jgi:CheY-like chemotaxis protein
VKLETQSSLVRLTVEDTGAGISEALLPHIFDRFKQGDSSASRRFGGLGLGLSLVKQLIELHGGDVTVKSDGEGKGTQFTVILPLRGVSPGVEKPNNGTYGPPSVQRLDGVRILIVDDDEAARETTALMLREYGLHATTVGSVCEAMTALELPLRTETLPFDIVVSDLGMPGEDGYEFIRRVRSHADERINKLRAIALTAYARTEDRLRALAAGYHMHSAKPVEEQDLTAVIASLLDKTQEEQSLRSDRIHQRSKPA